MQDKSKTMLMIPGYYMLCTQMQKERMWYYQLLTKILLCLGIIIVGSLILRNVNAFDIIKFVEGSIFETLNFKEHPMIFVISNLIFRSMNRESHYFDLITKRDLLILKLIS